MHLTQGSIKKNKYLFKFDASLPLHAANAQAMGESTLNTHL